MRENFVVPIKWWDEDMRKCGQCRNDFKYVVSVAGFPALKETWFCDKCLEKLRIEVERALERMKNKEW